MADPARVRLLRDRVLVRRIDKPTDSGLVVIREHPEMVDFIDGDKTGAHNDNRRVGLTGVVVAVGPGVYDEDGDFHRTTVQPGEVVMFTAWNDAADIFPGHNLIREGDIWGWVHA